MMRVEEAQHYVKSMPIRVDFAGFTSTTLDLQKAGWNLAISQETQICHADYALRLLIKHPYANVIGLSDLLTISYSQVGYNGNFLYNLLEHLKIRTFTISKLSPEAQCVIYPMVHGFSDFQQIDATPTLEAISPQHVNLSSIELFNYCRSGVEVFLEQKSIDELQEIILNKQAPHLKEIRDKRKQEQLRELRNSIRCEDKTLDFMKDVRLQLIAA